MAVVETDWAAVQDAIVDWLATATGLQSAYRDEGQYLYDEDHMLCHLNGVERRSTMTVSKYYDADLDGVVPYTSALLDLTVEVTCISLDQHRGTLAQQRLAQLITRYVMAGEYDGFAASGYDRLQAVGLSVLGFGPIVSTTYDYEGRLMSQATCECRMSLHDVYYDSAAAYDYIEDVQGPAPDYKSGTVDLDVTGPA